MILNIGGRRRLHAPLMWFSPRDAPNRTGSTTTLPACQHAACYAFEYTRLDSGSRHPVWAWVVSRKTDRLNSLLPRAGRPTSWRADARPPWTGPAFFRSVAKLGRNRPNMRDRTNTPTAETSREAGGVLSLGVLGVFSLSLSSARHPTRARSRSAHYNRCEFARHTVSR